MCIVGVANKVQCVPIVAKAGGTKQTSARTGCLSTATAMGETV